jgi:two-component system, probable response regulator PhcQ
MDTPTDYGKHAILYVDDEVKSLRNFARAFGGTFRILTASNAREGLRMAEEHKDDIGVLMTDERMPGERGGWLLERIRRLEPRIVRILVTAYADMDAAIHAVNSGAIYKYVTKPWDPPELETLLKRALDYHTLQRERDRLLEEKLAMLHNLLMADRIVSLGLLAAGMSHHIRNALVAVKTFLELTPAKLREEGVETVQSRNADFWGHYWGHALSQVDRINSMLNDLWAAAEKPTSDFNDPVELQALLGIVTGDLAGRLAQRRVRVDFEVAGEIPVLHVDRKKFRRLFELLLEDEMAYLPPGSTIQIRAQLQEEAAGPGPVVRIEIQDDGPGIPQAALQRIFDPFSVRNNDPSEYGIRLMACFFIVHSHRGNIIAQSAEGKGTTFVLRIPVNARGIPVTGESQLFLDKVQLNDAMWSKLLASG